MGRLVLLLFLLASSLVIQEKYAYSALFIGAVGSKSHKNFYMGIITELINNGNQVTLVTPFPSKGGKGNIREIAVPEGNLNQYNINRFKESNSGAISKFKQYNSYCVDTLERTEVQDLVKEKFDVVLISAIFSDCYLPLVYQLKAPFIYVSPTGLLSMHADILGNPTFPSIAPAPIFEFTHPLTFAQRTASVLADFSAGFILNSGMSKILEWDIRKIGQYPDDVPPITEIQKNASLIFLNSVRELEHPPRPYVSNVVHVGGIHCQPAGQLPQDLQQWIDGAGEDGFIFFSLGSAVKPSDLPEEHRKIMINVFGSLKQRVLWKWDKESMPDMPPNVRIGKWLPQQDILGHPKLRLFITHGGILSTFESIYHGRPILGLPVFADQTSNMKEVDRQGWGKILLWKDLTEEVLFDKITSVMTDEKLQQNVQLRSRLMRDQPISPKQLVTYWTDYVVRYNGARHLRCPIGDMPWYKTYNIDVWIMITTLSLLVVWLIARLILALFRCFRRKPKSKKD